MKRSDQKVCLAVLCTIALLYAIPNFEEHFRYLSKTHGYLLSFVKFSILATFGELLALRIVSGAYWKKNFGLFPKIIVWGFLGVGIKAALVIFATGVPAMLASTGLAVSATGLATGSFMERFILALGISTCLNSIFAPIFMTLHKITDGHISDHQGRISALYQPIDMAKQFKAINWDIQWGFVFKKTIPFFWIPAHTITFLLPADFRVLFAALLGVVLGIILAFANLRAQKQPVAQGAASPC